MYRFVMLSSLGLLGAALFPPSGVQAQFREAPPPPAYAIQNLTMVHPDGSRESGVTVVVRRGLIESLGVGATVPPDASVLAGDSLYLYPGLVDAHGSAEVGFPEIERPEDAEAWNAPRSVQGFMPHRRIADHLTATGEDTEDMRTKGVVAAGIHPDGGLAAGQGAAVLFRKDADTPWGLIANADLGLAMAFQPARGAYPSQLFGIIAYIRQAFEDANRYALWQAAYASDPSGLTMPAYDPDYTALLRASSGQVPVFFAADDAEDIRRVLMLSDEYGFRPVIVGGEQAWKVADELAGRRVPVLVNVDFDNPTSWDPDAEDQTSLEPAAAREKKRLEEAYSNSALLERAGVIFALTSGGGDGELRDGARKAIEYGLSVGGALRAVTVTPAELMGIGHVTRVEEGLAATFVVTDKPLFEEGSNVNYTFVEGALERGREPGAAPTEEPTVDVSGGWIVTVASQGMQIEFELDLEQDGNDISGSATTEFGQAAISGSISGNVMDFTMSVDAGGQSIEMSASGTVEGDSVSGSGSSPFGDFSFTGTRSPGAAR